MTEEKRTELEGQSTRSEKCDSIINLKSKIKNQTKWKL